MIRRFDVALPHGITLSCRGAGETGPRVLLLHGFPEAAFVWDDVMAGLAGRMRCTAPNLRGYEHSSAPAEVEAYRAPALLEDLTALIDATGGPLDLLVGHDWGGALAWMLAAQRPELLRRLLIVNAPHPAAFLRDLRDDPEQQAASAYMNALVRPNTETWLGADGYARLWPFLASPWRTLDDAQRERYAAVWRCGLRGPLNYYRASPLRPPRDGDDAVRRIVLDDARVTVRVPTTVLWADDDVALRPGLLRGLERWVPDLRLQRVPEASHWIVHERPATVIAAIGEALRH